MGKWVNTKVHDEGLDYIATANQITVCSAQPTTRAEAITTYALATANLTSGDITKAAGDVSGRKITISEKVGTSVTTGGTNTHIAIVNTTDLVLVTTCESQPLTAGNTITTSAFKYEKRDPS